MKIVKKITIIGEDRRACILAQNCARVGYDVIICVETDKGNSTCLNFFKRNKESNSKIEITSEFELAVGNTDLIINIMNPLLRRRKLSILTSVFSSLDTIVLVETNGELIEKISSIMDNPKRLLGIKMFYPFSLMNSVEFITSSTTSMTTINITKDFFLSLNLKVKVIHNDKFDLTYNRIKFQLLMFKQLLTKKSPNQLVSHYRYVIYKMIKKWFSNVNLVRLWSIKSFNKMIFRRNLKVNIGGGFFYKRRWRVLDFKSIWYSYPSVYIDYNFNLMSENNFPFKDNSVKYFYTSHTLEHIPQEYSQHILNEIYRTLKPKGAVRIVLPDFDIACEAYKNKDSTPFDYMAGESIHHKFLQFFAASLRHQISSEEVEKNFKSMKKSEFADYYCNSASRDTQKRMLGGHINWWNFEKLEAMLKNSGFIKIYRSEQQKSHFKEMRGSKGKGKFDTTYPKISLFVEAIK